MNVCTCILILIYIHSYESIFNQDIIILSHTHTQYKYSIYYDKISLKTIKYVKLTMSIIALYLNQPKVRGHMCYVIFYTIN